MWIILLSVLLSGCILIDTELRMPDETVQPRLTGEDCVPIILGIGIGTARMRDAMRAAPIEEKQTAWGYQYTKGPEVQIARVHRMILKDGAAFGFGWRCIQVTGEP